MGELLKRLLARITPAMNTPPRRFLFRMGAGLLLPAAALLAQAPALPDAPGRDVVQRVCGACHPATIVLGHGMTREGWGQTVASMITRGAKGSPEDFTTVTDYLVKNLPPSQGTTAPGRPQRRRGGLPAGPSDKQVVDTEAANRGKTLFAGDCGSCHGMLARGGQGGSDLVRSSLVLHDRYGDELGPFLHGKHPALPGKPFPVLTATQMNDIGHFIHQQVDDTLRGGPYSKVLNVLTGNATEGAAYFNGPGGCNSCHSPSGDLAGIARKYDPPTLQQRLLFPHTVSFGAGAPTAIKPVTVTVTPQNGTPVSGTLAGIDDFDVALRDASGAYHSWKRTPDVKIERHDPYAAHEELLDKITDKDIHDLVAYLETLK
jgi:mono/diheme cytochrome c family protein